MRNHDIASDLLGLLFKNHVEMLERATRHPAFGFTPPPFNVELHLGPSDAPARQTAMQLQVREGHLFVNAREGEHTLEFRAALSSLNSPTEKSQLFLTLGDHTGRKTHEVSAEALASLLVPEAFRNLQAKLVKHLQTMFPSLVARGDASTAADTTPAGAPQQSPDGYGSPTQGTDGNGDGLDGRAFIERFERNLGHVAVEAQRIREERAQAPKPEFTCFVVPRHNQADLRFEGKLVAGVQSALMRGRCFILSVYQTKGGKFVGVKRGVSLLLGERDNFEALVAGAIEELVPFFGYSPLPKVLYQQLGLTTDEVVE